MLFQKHLKIHLIIILFILPIGLIASSLPKKLIKLEDQLIAKLQNGEILKAEKTLKKAQRILFQIPDTGTVEVKARYTMYQSQVEVGKMDYPHKIEHTLDSALRYFEQAGSTNPLFQLHGVIQATHIVLKEQNFYRATRYYEFAKELSKKIRLPDNTEAQLDQLELILAIKQGYWQKANEMAQKSVVNYRSKAVDPEILEFFNLCRIKALVEWGDYHHALEALSKQEMRLEELNLHDTPLMVDLLFLRGLTLDQLHLTEEALAVLENAFEMGKKLRYGLGFFTTLNNLDDLAQYLAVTYVQFDARSSEFLVNEEYFKVSKKAIGQNYALEYDFLLNQVRIYLANFEYDLALEQLSELTHLGANRQRNLPNLMEYWKLRFLIHEADYQPQIAHQDLNELLDIADSVYEKDSPVLHAYHLQRAELLYLYTNDLKESEKIFESSLHTYLLPASSPSNTDVIYYRNLHIQLLTELGYFNLAEKESEDLLKAVKKYYPPESYVVATQLNQHGLFLIENGKFRLAFEAFQEASDILNTFFPGDAALAQNLKAIARLNMLEGNYRDAKKKLKRAQKITEEAFINQNDVGAFADLYFILGQYNRVKKLLDEALERTSLLYGQDSKRLIPISNRLVEYYLLTGDYDLLDDQLAKSQTLVDQVYGDNTIQQSEVLHLKGRYLLDIGNFHSAHLAFVEALEIQKTVLRPNHIQVSQTMKSLALTSYIQGDKATALDYLQKCTKNISNNLGEFNVFYANNLYDLATYYIEVGSLDRAEEYLEMALETWDNMQVKPNQSASFASLLSLLGELELSMGKLESALKHFEDSKSFYDNTFGKNHPKSLHLQSQMGKIYYRQRLGRGNLKKAIQTLEETNQAYLDYTQKYFRVLSEKEKSQYWHYIKSDFELFKSIAGDHYLEYPELLEITYNDILSTKALLLSNSQHLRESIQALKDTSILDKYDHWMQATEELQILEGKTSHELSDDEKNQKASLKSTSNTLEKEISKAIALPNEEKSRLSWKEIKSALGPKEFAVEIIRYRHFDQDFSDSLVYAALIVDKNTNDHPKIVFFPKGNEMETRYFTYYQNAQKYHIEDKESYTTYWKPLAESIPEGSTIYLSSEGVFTLMNPQQFRRDDGSFVLDHYDIVQVSNTKEVLKKENAGLPSKSPEAMVLGGPDFYPSGNIGSHLSPLEGAKLEAKEVGAFLETKGWKIDVFTDQHAHEDTVKKALSPTVLHIATHGYFLGDNRTKQHISTQFSSMNEKVDPLLTSGVILAGGGDLLEFNQRHASGILTAKEACNLKLAHTQLVVLSACETGKGHVVSGEGVYGIQRGFMVAGSDAVIMSLFKVSDHVTTEIMTLFYQHWIATGNRRKGFKQAMQEIKSKYPEPLHWGAFVMVGI